MSFRDRGRIDRLVRRVQRELKRRDERITKNKKGYDYEKRPKQKGEGKEGE